MKKISFLPLLLALLLGACSNGGDANESTTTQQPTQTIVIAAETAVATKTVVPGREVVLADIENDVSARALFSEDFSPASTGMNIHPSGGVETGVDGRARLDLLSEGTIVRVGPNSSFTIPEITVVNSQPKTTIELLFGKIFILLNGGSLDVKTSMGVASGRGSLMRVEYDFEKKLLIASCLEGHCTLKNKNGGVVDLVAGEFSYIEGGQSPVNPEKIYREEIQEWLAEIPELAYFLAELPNPKDYPEQIHGTTVIFPIPIPTPTHDGGDDGEDSPSYPNP